MKLVENYKEHTVLGWCRNKPDTVEDVPLPLLILR